MAILSTPTLKIDLINKLDADVTATVDISLTPFEIFLVTCGLVFSVKCILMGEDNGPFQEADDELFIFQAQVVTVTGKFTFRSTVNRSTLDEDSIGGDEIFVTFVLQSTEMIIPFMVRTTSPIIRLLEGS